MTACQSVGTTVVLLLILSSVKCGPGGHVSILLRSFSNPSNHLLNGDCCDPACANCNYYFTFCIRDTTHSSSCLLSGTSKTYHNYKHLVFAYGDNLGNGWKNPLRGTFSSWKGILSFSIDVMDYDYFSGPDVVDRFTINKAVPAPTPWRDLPAWQKLSLGGGGHPSTMELKYNVQCNQDYYGPTCTTHCVPRDDDTAGHFTCDRNTGQQVCRVGWHGNNCKVYCVPHDNDTHGHYTCQSGSGKKQCLQGWYGSSCTMHCVARNDSLAGYTCDSHGQKICLQYWYGNNRCDVYCKQTNDSTSGYNCDASGNKVCLQGWYGPKCDCSPQNDSYMGYTCDATTGERLCLPDWFSGNCDVYCSPRNNSAGHYVCHNQTGAKECLRDWFGANCTVYCKAKNNSLGQHECTINGSRLCARNWYGLSCSVYCASRNDETGHYTCHPDTGQKICNQGWYGANCTTHCVPKDTDWFGHYNCSAIDGSKQCHRNWYGTQCTMFCAPRNDSLGHYTCDTVNGSKICLQGWFGTECRTFCEAKNSSQGHYSCGAEDGSKICHKDWYGCNCTVQCIASVRNDSKGTYGCDPNDGRKICHQNWYGINCSIYCVPRRSNIMGHYECNIHDGTRICHPNWYGKNCTENCLRRNDSEGHYECDAVDGSLSCHQDWYGCRCTVYCSPQNSSAGHYTCDFITGRRICLPGWRGNYCLQGVNTEVRPSTNNPFFTHWNFPTIPSDLGIKDKLIFELWLEQKGQKTIKEVIAFLTKLLVDKLSSLCQIKQTECGLPEDWVSLNRTFNTNNILMEVRETSNRSFTVEVAAMLPQTGKGSVPGRILKQVILTNHDLIENLTSAEVRNTHVNTPNLHPGLSGSAVSINPSTNTSWLLYVLLCSGLAVVLCAVVVASWSFRKLRRRTSRVHVIKVSPADEDWAHTDNIALMSTASLKEAKNSGRFLSTTSPLKVLPCSAV